MPQTTARSQPAPLLVADTTLYDLQLAPRFAALPWPELCQLAELAGQVGFALLEISGPELFATALQQGSTDPWRRIHDLRAAMPDALLSMRLNGAMLLGERIAPRDVLVEFISRMVAAGIDCFRIADPLNDWRNLAPLIDCAKRQGALVIAEYHCVYHPSLEAAPLRQFARQLQQLAVDYLGICDRDGLLKSEQLLSIADLFRAESVLPLALCCGNDLGYAATAYQQAAADVALSPLLLHTTLAGLAEPGSLPQLTTLLAALAEPARLPRLKVQPLKDYLQQLKELCCRYAPIPAACEPRQSEQLARLAASYRLPRRLVDYVWRRDQDLSLGRLVNVLDELLLIQQALGLPAWQPPFDRIIADQAILNVIGGEPYKLKLDELKDYCYGRYGQPLFPSDPQTQFLLIGKGLVSQAPAIDQLQPQLAITAKEIGSWAESREDILSYYFFPDLAGAALKHRWVRSSGLELSPQTGLDGVYPV